MTKTKYYDLQMDDPQDDYDVDVVNANLKKIDEQMKTRENATDALQEPEFTVAAKRENIASKEKMPKILGKIAKFFADLKTVAFSGKYNDLDGKPAIVNNNTTTEPGSALDARQANPNIEGTMAASIAQINSNLNNNRDIIWSGINTLAISAINSWVASDKTITLQPGKYILGFKASTVCKNNVYLDTSIDTKEYTFPFFEKNVNVPIILITDAECTRSVSNAFVAWANNPVELHFFCYASAAINITYEIWALKLL